MIKQMASSPEHNIKNLLRLSERQKGIVEAEMKEMRADYIQLEHLLELLNRLEKDAAELKELIESGNREAARAKAREIRGDVYYLFQLERRLADFQSIGMLKTRINRFALNVKALIIRTGIKWDVNMTVSGKVLGKAA